MEKLQYVETGLEYHTTTTPIKWLERGGYKVKIVRKKSRDRNCCMLIGRKVREGMFIVILGPVGVGKSTIIKGLIQVLKANSINVSKVFIKSFHGPSYILWKLIAKMLGVDNGYAPWYVLPVKGKVKTTRLLIALSAYIDAFFTIPIKIMWASFLKKAGYYVIFEEYVHSTLFDYVYSYITMGIKWKVSEFPLHLITKLISKYEPDLTVILMASESTLKTRWKLRGYGDPQLTYVRSQQRFLTKLKGNSVFIMNTDDLRITEIINEIVRHMVS